jgi:ribosomal protein L3
MRIKTTAKEPVKKKNMDYITAVKLEMSQLFSDDAKVMPYTALNLIDEKDVEKEKVLEPNMLVRVTGVSKGKGFTGTMKKWNFHGGPATHGSQNHRRPGSIGAQGYGRVLRLHKMPGRHGSKTVTFDSVFLGFDDKANIRIKGGVPGARNSIVYVYFLR